MNRFNNWKRLSNFDVRVGVNKNNLQNPTCFDRVRTVGQGQAIRLQCDPPIPGRYVSVQMFQQGYLTLCEVAVYSRVGSCSGLFLWGFYMSGKVLPKSDVLRKTVGEFKNCLRNRKNILSGSIYSGMECIQFNYTVVFICLPLNKRAPGGPRH